MNREIKFRGKRIDNGEWVFGYFVKDPEEGCRIYWQPFEEATNNTYHFVKSETVGQYTGLKDKNNKDVYEGDIVTWTEQFCEDRIYISKGVIEFKDGSFCINDGEITHYRLMDYELEIIGNIHQNPNLLES